VNGYQAPVTDDGTRHSLRNEMADRVRFAVPALLETGESEDSPTQSARHVGAKKVPTWGLRHLRASNTFGLRNPATVFCRDEWKAMADW